MTYSAASNNTRGMYLEGGFNHADIRGVVGYDTFTENQIGMGWAVAPMGSGVTLFSTVNIVVKLNATDIFNSATPTPLK